MTVKAGFLEGRKRHWIGLSPKGRLVCSMGRDEQLAVRTMTGECRAADIWEAWQTYAKSCDTLAPLPPALRDAARRAREKHSKRYRNRAEFRHPAFAPSLFGRRARLANKAMQALLHENLSYRRRNGLSYYAAHYEVSGVQTDAAGTLIVGNDANQPYLVRWSWYTEIYRRGLAFVGDMLLVGVQTDDDGVTRYDVVNDGEIERYEMADGALLPSSRRPLWR